MEYGVDIVHMSEHSDKHGVWGDHTSLSGRKWMFSQYLLFVISYHCIKY